MASGMYVVRGIGDLRKCLVGNELVEESWVQNGGRGSNILMFPGWC